MSSTATPSLAELRNQKGLSQGELASIAGVTAMSIYHYEKSRSQPLRNSYPVYAKALGVSVQELELSILETERRVWLSEPTTTPCEKENVNDDL